MCACATAASRWIAAAGTAIRGNLEITLPGQEFKKFGIAGSGNLVLQNLNQDMLKVSIAGSGSIKADGKVETCRNSHCRFGRRRSGPGGVAGQRSAYRRQRQHRHRPHRRGRYPHRRHRATSICTPIPRSWKPISPGRAASTTSAPAAEPQRRTSWRTNSPPSPSSAWPPPPSAWAPPPPSAAGISATAGRFFPVRRPSALRSARRRHRHQPRLDWDGSDHVGLAVRGHASYTPGSDRQVHVSGDPQVLAHLRVRDGDIEMDCRGWRDRTRDLTITLPGREFRKFAIAGRRQADPGQAAISARS